MNTPPLPDLVSLMNFIGDRYTFTDAHYPELLESTETHKRAFAIRHSLLHMNKVTGVIATEVEGAEHGGEMDREKLKVAVTKMLINTIKLAEELGMSPAELVARVPLVMKSA